MSGASLVGADLRESHLAKAELNQVRAHKANFASVDLLRGQFYEADLREAVLDRTNLLKTSFWRADLRGCSLESARFDRTSFDDAVLDGIRAEGATGRFTGPRTFSGPLCDGGALRGRQSASARPGPAGPA